MLCSAIEIFRLGSARPTSLAWGMAQSSRPRGQVDEVGSSRKPVPPLAPTAATSVNVERRLAALMNADVKGYSRLLEEDELATVRTLTRYREVISDLVRRCHGRVVDSPGDNLLAEFGSVVDAVHCAVEVQRDLRARNTQLPEARRMEFRIGITLGDVIVEGERLYGDGVNIASRLEGLAEAGGICLSGSVYDQVETKLALEYEYLGAQTVKNITKPVRVYRVRQESEPNTSTVSEKVQTLALPDQPSIA